MKKRRMRWVVDTNVLVSAVLWQGLPGRVIELAGRKTIQLYSSKPLLDELESVLGRVKFSRHIAATGLTLPEILLNSRTLMHIVQPTPIHTGASRDPDDDAVLACALAAKADAIVSGDDDLLSLRNFHGIPIVTVAAALSLIESAPG